MVSEAQREAIRFAEEYEDIRNWALQSLDLVRPEFLATLFPLFAYCFIDLIATECYENAKEFWKKFEEDHRIYYIAEFGQLSSLLSAEQLKTREFIVENNFINFLLSRDRKFHVKLSKLGSDLLLQYLASLDHRSLIKSKINNQLSIEISHDCPDSTYRPVVYQDFSRREVQIDFGVPGTAKAIAESPIFSSVKDKFKMPNTCDPLYSAWIEYIISPSVLYAESKAGTLKISQQAKDAAASAAAPAITGPAPAGGKADGAKADGSKSSGSHGKSDGAKGESKAGDNKSESKTASTSVMDVSTPAIPKANPLKPTVMFATVANSYDGMVSMDLSEDTCQVAAGFRDSCVRVWRLDEQNKKGPNKRQKKNPWFGRLLESTAPKSPRAGRSDIDSTDMTSDDTLPMVQLRGHHKSVLSVHQDSTNRLVLSSSLDDDIRLWDLHILQCVGKYSNDVPACDVKFSPIGYYFASGNMDSSAFLYETNREHPIRIFAGHLCDVTSVAWHGNATLLLTGSEDKTCRLWDIRTGGEVRIFQGCATGVSTVVCSPFGNMAAAGTDRGDIYTWDIGTGRSLAVLQGHQGPVHSVAFNSTSEAIVSGGADCTVRVWDVAQMKSKILSAMSGVGSMPHSMSGPGAASAPMAALSDSPPLVLSSRSPYHTKFTPIYKVCYTKSDVIFAGGPFSREKSRGQPTLETSLANATEWQAVSALGLSGAIPVSRSTGKF